MQKPWFRKFNKTWYVTVNGKQIPLAASKDEAFDKYHELMLAGRPEDPAAPLASILEAFLEWSAGHHEAPTYAWYLKYLQDLADHCGLMSVADLKPFHITRWLQAHKGWGDASQRAAITSAKRALNWAVAEGLITANPWTTVRRPPTKRREVLVECATHDAICAATDAAFRLYVIALRETGCRPGEVRGVDATMFDPRTGTWRFRRHKTGNKTGKPKIVYLTPCLIALSRILAAARANGPLFRNRLGRPWTANAVRCRMRRLREKLSLPAGTVAGGYRHTFTTEGLVSGIPIATMAELLGHSDTKMISAHYGHLDQRADHLRQAALKAARGAGAADV